MGFLCKRCGGCCLAAGAVLSITQDDVRRWFAQKRLDILSKIVPVRYSCESCNTEWGLPMGKKCPRCRKRGEMVFHWGDPRYPPNYLAQVLLGNLRCPFLKKVGKKPEYVCLIHETKPKTCRDFPNMEKDLVTKNEEECVKWGCKGYKEWKKSTERDQESICFQGYS